LDKQRLSVIAGQPVNVRCIAVGGNPPPLLDVYLDWFNITRLFDLRRSFELRRRRTGSAVVDGDAEATGRGLRAVDVTTVLQTRRFVARVMDDALTLHCRSSTPSVVPPVVSNITLFVTCQYLYIHTVTQWLKCHWTQGVAVPPPTIIVMRCIYNCIVKFI